MSTQDGRMGVAAGLVRTAFLVNAVYAESAREHGLTPQQGRLLCVLMARSYGMGELGAALGLAKSSLSGLVDRGERGGLVRREHSRTDTRAVRVTLTPRGRTLAEDFHAATRRRVEKLPSGLTAAERATLGGLLGRVVRENDVPIVFLDTTTGR